MKNQNIKSDDSFINPFLKEENDNTEKEDESKDDFEYMDINIWEMYPSKNS